MSERAYFVRLAYDDVRPMMGVIPPLHPRGLMDEMRKVIDADTLELVRPQKLDREYVMLVDERGRLKEKNYVNVVASWLYGAEQHGEPIVGHAVILKAIPQNFTYMTYDEAKTVWRDLMDKVPTAYAHISERFYHDSEA